MAGAGWIGRLLGAKAPAAPVVPAPQASAPLIPPPLAIDPLAAALDELPLPIWRRDATLRLIWVNRAYARAVDATPSQAVSEQRELAANVLDRSGRALAERARSAGAPHNETRHVVAGGQRRYFRLVEGAAGGLGWAEDITAVEEAEAELERHKSAHAEVLEQMSVAVAIYGPDRRLAFFNSAMCQLWSLDEAWLSLRPTLAEVLEVLRERRQLPEQADFRRYKNEQLERFTSLLEPTEELMSRPDGSVLRVFVFPHPMGGLAFTYEDVTSRLALESSYNTLIAVQRETLDGLTEGVAVFGQDGRLSLWNPAFAKIWELDSELLQQAPHVAELAQKFERFFERTAEAKGFRTTFVSNNLDRIARPGRFERSDASVIQYQSVLLPDGGVLNSFVDVTDSVRVEQALREKNAALEAADQLKLDFLANVSYQLRTPLNAMIGFAEILSKQYFGALNDKQMEYSEGLLEAGQRLVSLIDAVLDLSTIEAGYMRLNRTPVDLGRMLEEVHALTQEWARKQDIHLALDVPVGLGVIEADERRLKQVLVNLISNSIKFTHPGGEIRLSGRRDNEEEARLIVSDNGAGISIQDWERVFAPFERSKPRDWKSGAGVGLALVKSFVALHGGRVELESRADRGTIVTCVLPAHPPADAASG
jgi:signal transduction histidine kinase